METTVYNNFKILPKLKLIPRFKRNAPTAKIKEDIEELWDTIVRNIDRSNMKSAEQESQGLSAGHSETLIESNNPGQGSEKELVFD